jgi:hypothetical protein
MKLKQIIAGVVILCSSSVHAALVGVSGPASTTGDSPEIITPQAFVFDDFVTNLAMQGFDEAQGVTTTIAHSIDGGSIAAGTLVDSHMIFLNLVDNDPVITALDHVNVEWTFSGNILGVMSNNSGTFESNSTFELGSPSTTYAVFDGRGLEGNNGSGADQSDGYLILAALNVLRVSMSVDGTEPGDWIRVVTASVVPVPAAIWLFGTALIGLVGFGKRKASITA